MQRLGLGSVCADAGVGADKPSGAIIRNANSDAHGGQLINKELLFSMGMEVSFCKGRSALIGMAIAGNQVVGGRQREGAAKRQAAT